MRRWMPLVGLILIILLTMTGCSGKARQESWPGMTVVDDVLIAANVEAVQGLEAETGTLLWSIPEDGKEGAMIGFYAAPAYDAEHGLIITAGFKDRTIHAYRVGESLRERPTEAWSYPRGKNDEGAKGQYVAGGTIADNLFLIGNGDGALYALHLEDGTLAWSFKSDDRIWSTPLVRDDTVYVTSLDHHLYALALADGTLKWQVETAGAVAMAPVEANGSLWIGDFGYQIYRVDPASGEVLWTFTEGKDWFWATPVVGEKTIYFADVSGNVWAFDTETNTLRWTQTAAGAVFRGRGALSPDGKRLFEPDYIHGHVYVFDTENGHHVEWGEPLDNPGRLPGDLLSDGERLYTMPTLITQRYQVFDLESGHLIWEYPVAESAK